MSNFTTIQEWLDSNPSVESTQIIMNFIHRNVNSERKAELHNKKRELKKMEMARRSMEELGMEVTMDINEMIDALQKRIAELEILLRF